MKKALKFVSSIFLAVVGILAAITLFYFIQAKGSLEEAPGIFGYKPLTILSNSMQPTFNAGDIIIISDKVQPKEGEVITFKHPDGVLVTHRIVQVLEKDGKILYETKGDNNKQVDEVLTLNENIIGVQKLVIPNAGYIAKFIAGPIGFSLFIVLPLVVLLIIEIFQRFGVIGSRNKEHANKFMF